MEKENFLDRIRASKGWKAMNKTLRGILFVLMTLLLFMVFGNVVLRYIFKISFAWTEEIIVFLSVWMYFLGAVVGADEESHVKGDLLSGYITKPKTKRIHTIFINVYTTIVLAIFSVWMVRYALWMAKIGTKTAYLGIPEVIGQSTLGICVPLMTVLFAFHSIRYALSTAERFEPPKDTDDPSDDTEVSTKS